MIFDCHPRALFLIVMLGLDPSIQVNNIANFITWILRSSRRMTKEGRDTPIKLENDKERKGQTLSLSCHTRTFLFLSPSGLTRGSRFTNKASFITWILRSSRRMTEKGGTLRSSRRMTERGQSSRRMTERGQARLDWLVQ